MLSVSMRKALGVIQSFFLLSFDGAYRKSIGESGTSMVLSPNSSFFRYFKDKDGSAEK